MKLEQAIKNNDFEKIIMIFKNIPPGVLMRDRYVYNAIYVLIKNNYTDEAKIILNMLKKYIAIEMMEQLQLAINEQERINNMDGIKKEIYIYTLEKGDILSKNREGYLAYHCYRWGYEITKEPIFLYYIAKTCYKNFKLMKAKKYFEEYKQVGFAKLSKAYFYLSCIEKKFNNWKSATYYIDKSNDLDKIINPDYKIHNENLLTGKRMKLYIKNQKNLK